MQRILGRTEVANSLVPWVGMCALVATFLLLAGRLTPAVALLAGKHTSVSLSISITIVISLALTGKVWTQSRRIRAQNGEIRDLRARLERIDRGRLGDDQQD